MGATFALCDLWGRDFLISLGYSDYYASLAGNSLIFVGIAISAPIWGYLARLVSIRHLLILGATIGLLASGVYLYFKLSILALCILSFLVGVSQSSHILSFSYVYGIANKKSISAVFAFINLCGVAGGAIFQLVIGIVLDKHILKEVVMGIIPALFFIALIMAFIIKKDIKYRF